MGCGVALGCMLVIRPLTIMLALLLGVMAVFYSVLSEVR
jgi:hypothetical protein